MSSGSDATVASALSYYDSLTKQFGPKALHIRHFTPGRNLSEGQLWQKLSTVVNWCQEHGIPPMDFIRAQFECWKVSPHPKAKGLSYPTPRYIGITESCVNRYKVWCAKSTSHRNSVRQTVPEYVSQVISSTLSARPDLHGEEDFFRDPVLVRLLPPEAVKSHPVFQKLEASGAYADPLSRLMLRDVLHV